MVPLSLMTSKVNLSRKILITKLMSKVMKLNGSSSMLVILIDNIKLLSSSNSLIEKNNSPSKPNISIPNISPLS
jgi:hypothetical protein